MALDDNAAPVGYLKLGVLGLGGSSPLRIQTVIGAPTPFDSRLIMDYKVRTAQVDDAEAFSPLLASLGYPSDPSALKTRISDILKNLDATLIVAVQEGSDRAMGLLSMHFIPQLGLEGEVARIGFFVIDERCHGSGVGKLLESHAEMLARKRGCDRMVSHSGTGSNR